MRELKFRAWDTDLGRWVELTAGSKAGEKIPVTSLVVFNSDGNYEVSQFTGCKDQNGKDIYEGDILSDGAVVEWFDSLNYDSGGARHSGFYCKKWIAYGQDGELSYHDGFDGVEVIGNIFENPELLK